MAVKNWSTPEHLDYGGTVREEKRLYTRTVSYSEFVHGTARRFALGGAAVGFALGMVFVGFLGHIIGVAASFACVVGATGFVSGMIYIKALETKSDAFEYWLEQQQDTREIKAAPKPLEKQDRVIPKDGAPMVQSTPARQVRWRGQTATIKGSQILAMRDAVEAGDFHISRSKFKLSGPQYTKLQEIMVRLGRWQDLGESAGYQWTQDGVDWLFLNE